MASRSSMPSVMYCKIKKQSGQVNPCAPLSSLFDVPIPLTHLEASLWGGAIVEAHCVADLLAEIAAGLEGDATRHGDGSHAARLGATDAQRASQTLLHQILWQLRGLSAACLAHDLRKEWGGGMRSRGYGGKETRGNTPMTVGNWRMAASSSWRPS